MEKLISNFQLILDDLQALSSIRQGQKINIRTKTTISSTGNFQILYRYFNNENRNMTKIWLEKLSKSIAIELLIINRLNKQEREEKCRRLDNLFVESNKGLKNLLDSYIVLEYSDDICSVINTTIKELVFYSETVDKILSSCK